MSDKWLPIEGAPKGKKVIVAYKNALGNWRRVMARYYLPDTLEADEFESDEMYAPEGWYEETEAYEYLKPVEETPLLWAPLPPPPEQTP